MADDNKGIWKDAAGVAPTGTSSSPWARVLGDQGDKPEQPEQAAQAGESALPAAGPAQGESQMPQPRTPAPRPHRSLGGLLQQVDAGVRRFESTVRKKLKEYPCRSLCIIHSPVVVLKRNL